MYIAPPTHGAGTRPSRTQLKTAARKTTLNAGQCVRQPRKGRGRNRQAPPPPKKKQKEGGGRKGMINSPQPSNRPPTPPEAANPPPPEGVEDGTPEEAQGDHPPKTGNTKPGTAAHREKGHRKEKKKKKRATSPARKKEKKVDGGTGTTKPGRGKKKKKKSAKKKHTPTIQPRRAGHSRDLGPAHTPTPHSGTRNGGGQAGRPRNHTRRISRPKPKPNHKHQKEPTLEGQHHKPCPTTPTQDPSQDWRG